MLDDSQCCQPSAWEHITCWQPVRSGLSWQRVSVWTQVTKLETTAEVVRGGQWQVVPSAQLVPGDVIRLQSNWLLPCDCVLVQGEHTPHPVL